MEYTGRWRQMFSARSKIGMIAGAIVGGSLGVTGVAMALDDNPGQPDRIVADRCPSGAQSSGMPDYFGRGDRDPDLFIARYKNIVSQRSDLTAEQRNVSVKVVETEKGQQASYVDSAGVVVAIVHIDRYADDDWRISSIETCG